MSPRRITATYRLQVTRDFPLAAVRARVGYLHDLGVSHLYLSPLLAAKGGSTHGYDVIDHGRLNPELGTLEELRGLAEDLHARGMGIILDIVPNHMSASDQNACWDDVLERGRGSRYADWFDIDWEAPSSRGKVVLPVLGDELGRVIERGEIRLRIRDSGSRLAYFDRTFPLDGATLPKEVQLAQYDPSARAAAEEWADGEDGAKRLAKLIGAQNYRLVHWRRAPDEINYRRFFEVNDLVALRMETDAIFDATHRLVLDWLREGILDGIRVDHVDGLRDPAWYLARLRTAVAAHRHPEAPDPVPIFVEKILAADESLPTEWPVDGTTGYDFMNEVGDLFIDPEGYASIEAHYRGLRHNPSLAFEAVEREGKRRVLHGALRADVMRAARLASAWSGETLDETATARAIVELFVHLSVYRTYVVEPGSVRGDDRATLEAAFTGARDAAGADTAALDLLHRAFFAPPDPSDGVRSELVARLQQTSGPAAAKGVEDTALYVYVPLAARNEVGGAPGISLRDAQVRMHARNSARASRWPRSLNATNTHDTKRSADLRARLAAVSDRPDEWARHVARWRKLNKPRKRVARGKPAPDTNAELLFYQALVGLWPAPRPHRRVDDLPDATWLRQATDRLAAYMLKAAREAKTRTSWTESDEQYEKALGAFVRESMTASDDAHFLGDVARLTAAIADAGFERACARVIVHLMSPGVPDLYQGDELWSFTLVDPDNRRPVDFDRAASLLAKTDASADTLRDAFGGHLGDDRVKQALSARLLRFRREHADLVSKGSYRPLTMGPGLFAFARDASDEVAIAITRTSSRETGTSGVRGVQVTLPGSFAGRWLSVLTDREIELVRSGNEVSLWSDELIPASHPGDLLLRTRL